MQSLKSLLLAALILSTVPVPAAADDSASQLHSEERGCPPPPLTRNDLDALKAGDFAVSSAEERNRLAVVLLACFDDPDPAVRDGIVFEGLSHWLRAGELAPETIRALAAQLSPALADSSGDPTGFRKPFAALLLSEVARSDRLEPVLDDASRTALAHLAARYLASVTDYRGFDPREGWRHGVAHGADLVLQLGLNPRLDATDIEALLAALAQQVAPAGPVFYTFGEPERLARSPAWQSATTPWPSCTPSPSPVVPPAAMRAPNSPVSPSASSGE